ncbi:MAG TPA: hypothetical protein VN493_01400 [Thermoanaerobaculia bacterium]|nr:hypothetical protein [Thermoanaerobaculia bacterium]
MQAAPAGAVAVVRATRAIGPALAAVTRMLNQMRPALAKVLEALAKSGRGFKEFVTKALTVEKVMAAIGKAMKFVTVADAAGRLAVALAKVKNLMVEAATGFGILGRGSRRQSAGAATEEVAAAQSSTSVVASVAQAPASALVAAAGGGGGEPPDGPIKQTGDAADQAKEKVGALQGALRTLGDQGFGPAAAAAEMFEKPIKVLTFAFEGFVAVTETASSFDQLKLSLENMLGSAEGAGQAFQMIQDFAGRTPVSLETATEAFRQLWTAGIQPTQENMTAFGNAAAGFGKDLTAVTSAISGVDLGKIEGLEELGLQVEEQGNKLKISFQGVSTTVGNSSREVAQYLEQLGTTRFADGMEQQADTFSTGFDQVKEAFAGLLAALGGAGLLTALESMDGSFAKIVEAARPVAEVLGKGLGAAMGVAASAAEFLAEHAGIVASVLAGLSAATAVAAIGELVKSLSVAKGAIVALGTAVLANPIGLIVGAIAAVVAALVIFKDETLTIGETSATVGEWLQATWDTTKEYLGVAWDALKTWFASFSDDMVILWGWIKDAVLDGVKKIMAGLASAFQFVAGIVGGIGELLGVGFTAIVQWLRNTANQALAVIFSIPEAFSAAKQALEEGDVSGLFDRVRAATADNFSKDYVGEAFGAIATGIGNFANQVGDAVGAVAGKVKDWVVGVGQDFAELGQMFGTDVAARANELVASRPPEPAIPSPPSRIRPGAGGGGVDAEAAATQALEAIRASAAEAQAAFDELKSAPLNEVAEKYQRFTELAGKASGVFEEQRAILEKLPPKHEAVIQALSELNKEISDLAGNSAAARNIEAMSGPLSQVEKAAAATTEALAELEGASILDVQAKYDAFEASAKKTNETVEEARKAFAQLADAQGEVAKATEQLDAATKKVGSSQESAGKTIGKHSEEALNAAKALAALAEATPDQAPDRVNAFKTAMMELENAVAAASDELKQTPPGPEYQVASERLQQMRTDLEGLTEAGAEFGVTLETSTAKAAATLKGIYRQIVDAFLSEFSSALADLFQGSTEGFKNLFDNVGKFFSKMLADMVAEWLKAAIFRTGADATQFGQLIVNMQQGGAAGAGSAAVIGAGVGGAVGTAAGADPTVSYIAGAAGAAAGFTIGFQIGGAVGGVWGAFIGGVIGGLVAAAISYKPSERGYADLAAKEGFAVIDAVRVRGKADMLQLQKFSKGVTDAINEIVAMSGGALTSLPKITLETKKNKWYRVIDAAGITHKFGEDLKAATDFAVIQALKGAQFEGLSPEVQAAFKNTMATTIEELTSDIEFAVAVRDIDLEPVTKDLRDLAKGFQNMRERALALGIAVDKIDDAFQRAFDDMKKNLMSGLKPFQEAGLTDVEREARRITEAFEEMRENARLFNEELERQQQTRNEEIQSLQGEVARQQELLAQAQANPEAFIPPEILERFAALGMDPERLLRLATGGIEETIKKLLEEIARLQGLNESQTPIDMSEIDRAELAARRALRERVRDSLAPYQRANMTAVQQQLLELDDTFEKLRRDARAAGVSMREVDKAYEEAVKALRKQVMEQLQPYLDLADGLTPLQVELRDLDERFAELRTNAKALGIDMETVNRAEQAAREQLRQQFEDELAAFAGENPFVAQLDELRKKFEELKKNAEALGISTDRVNEAYQQALEIMQKQFQEGIQSYLDYGRGLSDIAVRHRDLTKFFEEQREAARALDEAMGFTGGGGPNERLLGEAEAAAFQQLVDEFKASLQDLRDAGLTPTEIAVRDMRDRFTQLREDAELLGLSVDELTRLELAAIERLRGELDAQLDRYLLSDEEQQQRAMEDEFLTYLRDALALYTYEPGSQEPMEPEPFPGARQLEQTFGDVKLASEELATAFRELRHAALPDGTTPPPPGSPDGAPTGLTPGELVASVLDLLEPLREGRGMEEIPAEQRAAIDAASTQVSLLLEQLRLGMTDDAGALQGALGNLVSLLQQSGFEIDGSLLALTDALGSGDIAGFLDELRDGVLGSTDGFGALIDILLSGGDLSLPDLMHQLASGTFDAIQAMLGLTEIPPELAETLKKIGLAWEAAQQQRPGRTIERGGGDDASREAEQRQRELDALLRQLEQFEDLQLSPAERELKKLNEQFDEMRENAARLGVSLDRVEAAYQIAIDDFWERLLGPLNEFRESLALSELSTLTPEQRLAEAQARFQDLATRALGGDLEAAQQLQSAAQQLLQEGQSFFASGQGYQDLFALVNSVIEQVLGNLAPGLLPAPAAAGTSFEALLAQTGWSWQDRMATAGLPFGTFAGDQLLYGLEPGERPAHFGAPAEGGPALAVDLSGVREGNRLLIEEVRLSRQQEHVDSVELQRRVDQQSEELKEVRALLRRLTSNTQYGGRAQ